MKYSKFFQYAYLIFAVLFLFKMISEYKETGVLNYAYLLLVALAVFIFFFRRKFNKKFDNTNQK